MSGTAAKFGLEFETNNGSARQTVAITNLVVAGWTGRDEDAVRHHIEELAALGVPRPKTTPIFYRVSVSRLTLSDDVEMVGSATSGEAEIVLLQTDRQLWVGLGSDHTDREAEAHGITLSKQLCDKPIAPRFWSFDEVKGHWDQLVLQSFIDEGGSSVRYQDGTVASLRSPDDLIHRYTGGSGLADGTAMFCGTHAAIGGIRPALKFTMRLSDPVLGRMIEHSYTINCLPIEG